MRSELGDEYALLVKHHPYVKHPTEIPVDCADFAFTVEMPIDQLLAAADVCITDYSSIVFEYSLFERPIAFFAPDLADYDDWRGFYYDYDELTPGPVFERTEPLVAWIHGLDAGFDPSEVHAFREKFMSACDGSSTKRILEAVGIA
jgi:CDP-glycerol glycerophosphotransferase (TagB/SpsB family)